MCIEWKDIASSWVDDAMCRPLVCDSEEPSSLSRIKCRYYKWHKIETVKVMGKYQNA